MSTRSCIAKPDGDAWKGRYHHSDGYPTGVGVGLFEAYHGFFGGDIDAMTKFLVDDEPVGWSFVIGTNFALGPQWQEFGDRPVDENGWTDYAKMGPQSYTARGETPFRDVDGTGDWITHQEGDYEYVYVLTPGGLMVGTYSGNVSDFVPWSDPDYKAAFEALEKKFYE